MCRTPTDGRCRRSAERTHGSISGAVGTIHVRRTRPGSNRAMGESVTGKPPGTVGHIRTAWAVGTPARLTIIVLISISGAIALTGSGATVAVTVTIALSIAGTAIAVSGTGNAVVVMASETWLLSALGVGITATAIVAPTGT